jgi:RNA polymerase sigma factor (sigma-70 family)
MSERSRTNRFLGARLSDRDLVAACLGGDEAAWDALVERCAPLVYAVACRAGLKPEDAADVFQEVCLAVLQHLGDLRDRGCLAGWLATTTRREVWRLRRRRRAQRSLSGMTEREQEEALTAHSCHASEPPDAALLALAEADRVRRAQERLPARCRSLLALLYGADPTPSYVDVAASLGLPVGSIGPSRARCLQNLKKILDEEDA